MNEAQERKIEQNVMRDITNCIPTTPKKLRKIFRAILEVKVDSQAGTISLTGKLDPPVPFFEVALSDPKSLEKVTNAAAWFCEFVLNSMSADGGSRHTADDKELLHEKLVQIRDKLLAKSGLPMLVLGNPFESLRQYPVLWRVLLPFFQSKSLEATEEEVEEYLCNLYAEEDILSQLEASGIK